MDGYVDIACFDSDGEVMEEGEICLRIGFSSMTQNPGVIELWKVLHRDSDKEDKSFVARFDSGEMKRAAHIAKIAEDR